ncbi:peptidase [Candidatus Thiomargarita nelsonii]|uniref:Peptidase n=1 Tax=Candidatus Thiomargarita nelsonii TaxID=1003181 RepID=A0A4E0RI69_9GAMM|nr:peptidase [Candidatus Thiomargarita nelsonii]
MEELTTLQQVTIWILPVLFAITVHEVAHGWVAFKLGDDTAYRLGRITLNPISHIDPIGTVLLPLLLFATTGFVFGWAKPVPVNFNRLRQVRRDMALVALAGPGANLLMAIFWTIIVKFGLLLTDAFPVAVFLIYMGYAGIVINGILMILNLLPILPLDGGRVLHSALPPNLAYSFGRLEPFGLIILVVLLLTGILQDVLLPMLNFMSQQFLWFVGLA